MALIPGGFSFTIWRRARRRIRRRGCSARANISHVAG